MKQNIIPNKSYQQLLLQHRPACTVKQLREELAAYPEEAIVKVAMDSLYPLELSILGAAESPVTPVTVYVCTASDARIMAVNASPMETLWQRLEAEEWQRRV